MYNLIIKDVDQLVTYSIPEENLIALALSYAVQRFDCDIPLDSKDNAIKYLHKIGIEVEEA